MDKQRSLRVPLTGYSDRLSARAGDSIDFKLSAENHDANNPAIVKSWLVQSICADPNPVGPGIVERSADQWYEAAEHRVWAQHINAGSCALSSPVSLPDKVSDIQISATLWPTLLNGTRQCIMQFASLALFIDNNTLQAEIGDHAISLQFALQERQWIKATASIELRGTDLILLLQCQQLPDAIARNAKHNDGLVSISSTTQSINLDVYANTTPRVSIAAQQSSETESEIESEIESMTCHFNGKIEAPELLIKHATPVVSSDNPIRIAWNFGNDMAKRTIEDVAGHAIKLEFINYPARAMKSSSWSGIEMCWRHAADQYAAVHFHDDDLVDANWNTSFTCSLPTDMPSGVYVMRISDGQNEDAMPFFVCAAKGQPEHKLCVLVSTFTYAIYGNHARPDWEPSWQEKVRACDAYPNNPAQYPGYGLSTYNYHSDGSGICHASHLRPLFNLRPGYITFGNTDCSGLRHFQADSHLIAWLDAMNIGFDIITDRELHDEGVNAISGYDMLMTGSHPEYHTAETLDALQSFRDTGGHLSYLGGNGFYWRIALHPERQDTLEIRRAEAGIRAWAAEPGEYYQAFDGQYGGLWRRNGRPPQTLCGLGFSAQGQFNGSHYRRRNIDPAFEWIFKGIEGEVIGDFGLCGGGAAGFELDRADTRLGTPPGAVILASSESHSEEFILVPEEMLTHLTTLPGSSADELIRADMIWCDVPGGGSVFAVGSITFCGSLPHNNFQNSVSQLLKNVVEYVLGKEPAAKADSRSISINPDD